MKNYPLWKTLLVFLVLSLGLIFSIPTIIYNENTDNWFLKNKINLGLDLQGGSYLLLQVESDILFKEELENINDLVRQISRNQKSKINDITIDEDKIEFLFQKQESIASIREEFIKTYRDINAVINKNTLKIIINDNFKKRIEEAAIKQSLEIVRRRIDESGTKEPLIQRSGKKRILLQLPGVKDPERIKDLLGKTAKLNFHMVDDEDTKSLSLNIAPFGKMIVADINNEEIRTILGPMQKISLDHYDQNICIRGVPLNIALFTLGNRKVLRDWVSHHTDLRVEDNCLMHTTWNNDIRDEWFLEMSTVIHNIATLLLVRPRIEEYSTQVCANMLQWPPN
mgnify:CR=1 FL=1